MELSAAEEYAIKIIAAESGMQRPVGEMPAAVSAAGEGNSALELGPGREHDPAVTFNSAPTIACAAEPALAIPDDLWPAVRAELVAQSVIGYPAHAVESLSLNPADQAEYLALAGKNLSSWYSLMMAQDDVLAEFRAAGIPVVVLKGAAAAAHYPQPNSRSMGDIDLIVPPDHFEQAFSLMERLGWDNDIELEINPRHAGFKKAGCPEIELHRYFSTCTNKQQAHFLDQAIYDAIPRAKWTDVAGFSVPVLPPLENGLVLLAHVNQHLGSGLGLRQILDWQMFVDAHLTDELWERGFQHAAQQIGMEKLAVTTTWLCRTYLGLQTSQRGLAKPTRSLRATFCSTSCSGGTWGARWNVARGQPARCCTTSATPRPWFAIFMRAGALIGRQRASTRGLLQQRASIKWGTLYARDSRATRA